MSNVIAADKCNHIENNTGAATMTSLSRHSCHGTESSKLQLSFHSHPLVFITLLTNDNAVFPVEGYSAAGFDGQVCGNRWRGEGLTVNFF